MVKANWWVRKGNLHILIVYCLATRDTYNIASSEWTKSYLKMAREDIFPSIYWRTITWGLLYSRFTCRMFWNGKQTFIMHPDWIIWNVMITRYNIYMNYMIDMNWKKNIPCFADCIWMVSVKWELYKKRTAYHDWIRMNIVHSVNVQANSRAGGIFNVLIENRNTRLRLYLYPVLKISYQTSLNSLTIFEKSRILGTISGFFGKRVHSKSVRRSKLSNVDNRPLIGLVVSRWLKKLYLVIEAVTKIVGRWTRVWCDILLPILKIVLQLASHSSLLNLRISISMKYSV